MEAKCLSKDRISSLPSILVENILCRVPIRDALRTSILSRNWRYNWATIPKLVFKEDDMFDKSHKEHQLEHPKNGRRRSTIKCKSFRFSKKEKKYKVLYAIHQVLLLHQDPIHEFTLSMLADDTCGEINQIILNLSKKNTLKKLALEFNWDLSLYRLPLSIFSFHQLTNLSLANCVFDFSPTFRRFGNLTSLSLMYVQISTETTLHLISSCPLLKRLNLEFGSPEVVEDSLTIDLNELVKCLPVIEHVSFICWTIESFPSEDLPTTLVHLKSFSMNEMRLDCKFALFALFLLIKLSPNLEKIEIRQHEENYYDESESDTGYAIKLLDDYYDIWLEHLKEFEIDRFSCSKLEMKIVKLILAKSCLLKKVRIVLEGWIEDIEELKMLRILLRCPRASLVVEIIVERVKW